MCRLSFPISPSLRVSTRVIAMPAIARAQAYHVVKHTLRGRAGGSVRRRYEE